MGRKKNGEKKKQMARKFTLMGKIDAMAKADVFPLKLSTTIVSLPWCVVWGVHRCCVTCVWASERELLYRTVRLVDFAKDRHVQDECGSLPNTCSSLYGAGDACSDYKRQTVED